MCIPISRRHTLLAPYRQENRCLLIAEPWRGHMGQNPNPTSGGSCRLRPVATLPPANAPQECRARPGPLQWPVMTQNRPPVALLRACPFAPAAAPPPGIRSLGSRRAFTPRCLAAAMAEAGPTPQSRKTTSCDAHHRILIPNRVASALGFDGAPLSRGDRGISCVMLSSISRSPSR
jgi:hypothetical protein